MLPLNLKDLFEYGVVHQPIVIPALVELAASDLVFKDTNETYNDDSAPLLSLEVSQSIIDFWNSFLPTYEKPFSDIYGLTEKRQYCAHSYRQGDGLEWHSDCSYNFPLNHILYIGDQEWHLSFGGYLSVKKDEPLNILPTHGTLVTLLNWNPFIQHKVERLRIPLKRISLMCKSGY